MKTITIYLTDQLGKELKLNGKAAAINTAAIERLIKKERNAINRWLLFGEAQFCVTDDATGEVVAEGHYSYNAFSGQGNYELYEHR